MMVAVDGGEVWTDDSAGGGPPVVLLHPGIGDSRIWDPVLPALTASRRIIRYDARGFGRSAAPTVKFSLLADLITVLDHLGLDRVAIVGCSQGGGSALSLALEHPARVSALVLLCPGIPGYPWPEEAEDELDAEYEHALQGGDVDALAGLMQRVWAAAGPTPAVMDQLRSAARAEIASVAASRLGLAKIAAGAFAIADGSAQPRVGRPSSPSSTPERAPPTVTWIRPAPWPWPPTTSAAGTTPSASGRPCGTSAQASARGRHAGSLPNSTSGCTARRPAGPADAHRHHRAPRAAP